MKRQSLILLFSCMWSLALVAQPGKQYNLNFDSLATRWDEAIPLGNGWLGALIWQKKDKIRMSLDRVDLWDDRPMPEIDKLTFKWVIEQVRKGEYDTVQKVGDVPYDNAAAPTKIPGAALEFSMDGFGKVLSNELDIKTGLSVVRFQQGEVMNNYIHATNQVGYFSFENISPSDFKPSLSIPDYNTGKPGSQGNSLGGTSLERLGYTKGTVTRTANSIRYHQPTWSANYYEVLVKWYVLPGKRIIGQWTISNNKPAQLQHPDFKLKEPTHWPAHIRWWNDYWSRSSISIPDTLLERQYYREMYKFACVARANTPPISLQAVWTADDGMLPPWKGDFHHDLNTQLSYWPGYTANHLDLTASYTNWLWKVRDVNRRWTRNYFGVEGLNVPGVTTISGREMGGWIQYSMSPTTVAWITQHFYWQWKFSMDRRFLLERAKPYILEAASFLGRMTDGDSIRGLPISSSPEYNDNTIKAWFSNITNYDLSLAMHLFDNAWAVEASSGAEKASTYWFRTKSQLPAFDVNKTGLTVAPGQNLDASHRHFSPYMAIYPLCLLDTDVPDERAIIDASIRRIEEKGTSQWCGYSFSWMASIYARAREARKAVEQLRIFATNFCSPNSFHLNGDQKGGQHSTFTYRPFTLEGNFAFAQGVHELLVQSRGGHIEVFPAIPADWKDVTFRTLRTEGAFLISGKMVGSVVDEVKVTAEQANKLSIKLPFKTFFITNLQKKYTLDQNILEVDLKKGETIIIKNGYE